MIEIRRTFNRDRGFKLVEPLNGYTFTPETNAHTFFIECVDKVNGLETVVPFDAGSTVSARFLKTDHVTELVEGSLNTDGAAVVTLPSECYSVPGRFLLTILVTTGSTTICVYAATGTVIAADSSTVNVSENASREIDEKIAELNAAAAQVSSAISAGSAKITEINQAAAAARASIPQDYTALSDSVCDLKSAIGQIDNYWNFEQGSLSVTSEPYVKTASANMGRTVAPFYVTKGTTIAVINPSSSGGHQFWLQTYDPATFARTQIGWKTSYTFTQNCFAMFAFQSRPSGALPVTEELVRSIFTADSIKTVCSGVMVSGIYDERFNTINTDLSNVEYLNHSYATAIPANSNIDDYTTPGNFYVATASIATSLTSWPSTVAGRLTVYTINADTLIYQEVTDGNGIVFSRRKNNSGWSNWGTGSVALDFRAAFAIPANSNIDDYTTPGNYLVATSVIARSLTSWPSTVAGRLTVYTINADTLIYQEVTDGNGIVFSRRKNDSGWSNWVSNSAHMQIDLSGAIEIPADSDLDDYKTLGTYYIRTAAISKSIAHNPSLFAGKLFVLLTNSNSSFYQLYLANDGKMFSRVYSNGAWLDWILCGDKEAPEESNVDTIGAMNTAHEIKSALTYKMAFANGVAPIKLRNYKNNIQNVHPKVLYFANGFGGYNYWMAYTPYPYSNDTIENPCVAYSYDGFRWTNIKANPLSDPHGSGYNSDTHLVYRSDTSTLECWYRYVDPETQTIRRETIYRRTTTDGVNWTEQEQIYKTDESAGNYSRILSPSVLFEDGKYKIWCVDQIGTNNIVVAYYEAPGNNVTAWTHIRDYTFTPTDNGVTVRPWHLDVINDNGNYIMLIMCRNGTNVANNHCSLFITESADNITYSAPVKVVEGSAHGWDRYMYRSSIVKIGDKYRIYYSAGTGGSSTIYTDSIWGIGITESSTLNGFVGY